MGAASTVGNANCVPFNSVFARRSDGTLVLRIEDTNAAGNRPEWVDRILDAMPGGRMGPGWRDGPPFHQGGRTQAGSD